MMLTGTELHSPFSQSQGTGREGSPRFLSEDVQEDATLGRFGPLTGNITTFVQDTLGPVLSTTRGAGSRPIESSRLIQRPTPSAAAASLWALQAWEGRVVLVDGGQFTAILKDAGEPSRADEEVTIELAAVDPSDRSLVVEGATFFWSVFQEVRQGTRRVVSDLRFRRLPIWTANEIDDLKRRAAERAKRFGIKRDAPSID
jgi:hypothetical protein